MIPHTTRVPCGQCQTRATCERHGCVFDGMEQPPAEPLERNPVGCVGAVALAIIFWSLAIVVVTHHPSAAAHAQVAVLEGHSPEVSK